jgi:hypothetical protein
LTQVDSCLTSGAFEYDERRDNILLEQVAEALGAKYVEELDI